MNKPLPVIFSTILVIVVLAGYHHTLSGPFIMDDEPNIVQNPYIRIESLGLDSLRQVFSSYQPSQSRPVANLSFAVNYLVNGYDPAGYRAVNIFIHILAACVVFRLFAWYFRKTDLSEKDSLRLAFFGALLWGLNPIQTNAVTYIVQRMTSLSALFFVSSLLAYLYGRDRVRSGAMKKAGGGTIALFAVSLLFFVLALMTKQIAVVLPVVILLHEIFFFQGLSRERVWKNKYFYLAALFIPVALAILFLGPGFWKVIVQGYGERDFTLWERLLTQSRVVVRYFSLFLLPLPSRLTLFYDYPVSRSILDPAATLPSILAILSLITGACLAAGKYPLAAFGMMWTFVTLALESTVLPLELIFEHRFYLPSIGFSLALMALSFQLSGLFSLHNRFFNGFWICAACFLLLLTYQRNLDWKSLVSIYEDGATKTPGLVRVVNGLGVAYMRAGRISEAEMSYQRGLQLDPDNVVVLANLYTLHSDLKQPDKAEPYLERLKRSIRENHFRCNESMSILLLSEVLVVQGRYGEVIFLLESLARCGKKNAPYYDNLGLCYSRLDNHAGAIENFSKAVELDPENPYYLFSLARSYLLAGDKDSAVTTSRKLQRLSVPDELRPHVDKLNYHLFHR